MKRLATLAFFFTALLSTVLAADRPPNIIFILVDDLGWGDVGVFYQNARRDSGDRSLPYHSTPNLDRMAADGARFTQQYVAAPVCAPSRASILQGVNQGQANVRDNQFDKALDENHTLATVLHQAGYATAAIGKWGVHGTGKGADFPAHPLSRGFDYYYGCLRHVDGHEHYPKEALYFGAKAVSRGKIVVWENHTNVTDALDKCYTTDLFTARAKQWIAEQTHSSAKPPFFLYLAYDTPHAVLELPTQPYPAGGGLNGGMQWLGEPGHAISTASGIIDSWTHPDYASATWDDDHNPATPEKPWPDINRRYATSVRRIDDAVGDLLQLLRDLKIDQNTLVVFASDNGPSIESYLPAQITPEFFASFGPMDGIKRDCWEGGLRTPTIARWPGHIPADRVLTDPTATWDWMPTFADAAGLPSPARSDGESLLPLLEGKAAALSPRSLYFEYFVQGKTPDFPIFEASRRSRRRDQMQAIRKGDLMAVRYDIKSPADDFEIYNVVTDPKEAHDLAANPAFSAQQVEFKALALQSHRPDPEAPRPYDSAPVPATEVLTVNPGIAWQAFTGLFPWVPSFENLPAAAHGVAATIDAGPLAGKTGGGLFFEGYLRAPADGDYTFTLRADTGALLRLHEAVLIDADFGYQAGTTRTATIHLKAGLHPLRLWFIHKETGQPELELKWTGPGFADQAIPADVLFSAP